MDNRQACIYSRQSSLSSNKYNLNKEDLKMYLNYLHHTKQFDKPFKKITLIVGAAFDYIFSQEILQGEFISGDINVICVYVII